ncbi:MAG: ferredoxin [Coriobacteriia bacterium]|nr:ferredoxin [Coriobacteriia bacterium]
MKANVDRDLCIGCGLCEQACPEVFRMGEDGLAMVIDDDPPAEAYPDIEGCVELCPVAAISVNGT